MTGHLKATLFATLLSAACLLGSTSAQTGPISGPSTVGPTAQPTASLSESDLEAALRARDSGLRVRYCIEKDTRRHVGTRYRLIVRANNVKHRLVVQTSTSDPAFFQCSVECSVIDDRPAGGID